jgi:hypothetical protein
MRENLSTKGRFYDEENHKYFLDGVELPSVTEIAKPISNERLNSLQNYLVEIARKRGSRCHELFEQYFLLGDLETEEIESDYFPYVQQFVLWAKAYRPKVLYTEKILFGEDFCGTADLICVIDGKLCIVDYKVTSQADKKSLSVQLEGYYRLCRKYGIDIQECYYLHIKKDGYVFKPVKRDPEWFDILLLHNKKMRGKYDGK